MRIGVYLEAVDNQSHPIINIIKELSLLENIELFLISDSTSLISDFEHLNIEEGKVYFIGIDEFLNIKIDLCLSTNEEIINQFATRGIMGGFINKSNGWDVAFDHRLFSDHAVCGGIVTFLHLIGYLQRKTALGVEVVLMTTGSHSVDGWVLDVFKSANCKVNSVCYLPTGDKKDFLTLFKPCLFFEGKNLTATRTLKTGKPLIFI